MRLQAKVAARVLRPRTNPHPDPADAMKVGVVACYRLEGNFQDSGPHGNHLPDQSGVVSFAAGKSGSGLTGGTGASSGPLSNAPTGDWTVSGWWYATDHGGGTVRAGVALMEVLGDTGDVHVDSALDTENHLTGPMVPDAWNHVAVVYHAAGETYDSYLNGVPVNAGLPAFSIPVWTAVPLQLSAGSPPAVPLDLVVIYSRALLPAEVLNLALGTDPTALTY